MKLFESLRAVLYMAQHFAKTEKLSVTKCGGCGHLHREHRFEFGPDNGRCRWCSCHEFRVSA